MAFYEVELKSKVIKVEYSYYCSRKESPSRSPYQHNSKTQLHRNGQLYLNEEEQNNPHMERLAEQFMLFAPRSRGHDDGPDAVEGAVWKIGDMLGRGTGIITFGRTDRENRW